MSRRFFFFFRLFRFYFLTFWPKRDVWQKLTYWEIFGQNFLFFKISGLTPTLKNKQIEKIKIDKLIDEKHAYNNRKLAWHFFFCIIPRSVLAFKQNRDWKGRHHMLVVKQNFRANTCDHYTWADISIWLSSFCFVTLIWLGFFFFFDWSTT